MVPKTKVLSITLRVLIGLLANSVGIEQKDYDQPLLTTSEIYTVTVVADNHGTSLSPLKSPFCDNKNANQAAPNTDRCGFRNSAHRRIRRESRWNPSRESQEAGRSATATTNGCWRTGRSDEPM